MADVRGHRFEKVAGYGGLTVLKVPDPNLRKAIE